MAQAAYAPSTRHYSRTFEELPLFWESTPSEPVWRAGRIAVEADIAFDGTRDWWIADVRVIADNGETGPAALGRMFRVDPRDTLYVMVVDAIEGLYRDQIEQDIDDEFAEMGFSVVPA